MKKNKNISKKVPVGRTIQTRDEFLLDGENTKKDHPNKKDLFRTTAVIDSNYLDEIAIIKLSTKGRHKLDNYRDGKSTYNAYIVIQDSNGNKIKIDGVRFMENKSGRDLSKQEIDKIKKDCLTNPKTSKKLKKENSKKLRDLKGRK